MLQLQRSPVTTHNARLKKVLRRRGQGNVDYVAAHASKRTGETELVLLGGKGPVDFRLRIAQAHARDDLLPSAWSHAAILSPAGKASSKRATSVRALHEISLSGKAGVGYPPSNNGVQRGSLADYD